MPGVFNRLKVFSETQSAEGKKRELGLFTPGSLFVAVPT
jgi:hypothetical protein